MLLGNGEHDSEDNLYTCLQIPSRQEEAGIVVEPQLFPETEPLYVIKYERAEPSIPSDS